MLNTASGVLVHLEKIADNDLWTLSIFVDGNAIGKHTLLQDDVGATLLAALAQALDTYVGRSSAVRGALAWSPTLPAIPSKQEARQVVGVMAWVWRFVRAFLP